MKPTVEETLQIEVAQRFKVLIDLVGDNINIIAKECGIAGTSGLYQIIMSANPKYEGRRHLPSTHNLLKIKKKYPWMNMDYLLSGKGSPRLDKDSSNTEIQGLKAELDRLLNKFNQAEKLNKAYEMVIESGKKTPDKATDQG